MVDSAPYYVLVHLAQLFILFNITLQCAGTGKYTTPTRHLNFYFAPLAASHKLFSQVKSKTSGFLHDQTQQYTPVLFWKIPNNNAHSVLSLPHLT